MGTFQLRVLKPPQRTTAARETRLSASDVPVVRESSLTGAPARLLLPAKISAQDTRIDLQRYGAKVVQ